MRKNYEKGTIEYRDRQIDYDGFYFRMSIYSQSGDMEMIETPNKENFAERLTSAFFIKTDNNL